jgi:ABC-type multidrug transport system ATPase subunit
VVLAELAWAHPHLLFLDEPSNHLDLDAIEALAQGLNAFSGGVVLISHNQRLISLVCNEIWVVTKAGTVDRFNGEFDEYKEQILEHMDFAGIEEDEEDEQKEKEEKKKKKDAGKEKDEERGGKKAKKNKK